MGPRASSGSFYLRAGEGSGLWTGARSLSPRSRLPQLLAYPNYEDSLEESFVYLENKGRDGEGDYTFGPRTFEGSARKGRWLVLDSGDLGYDGDVDLMLGLLVGLFARGPFRKGRPRRRERRFQPRGKLRPAVIVADLPHPGFRGN